MRKVAWTTILMLTLTGCANSSGIVTHFPQPGRSAANLAIGPTRDHAWLAESFTYRSAWPSTPAGYIFNDTSSYTEIIYDDQSYYDDGLGGGYMREAISIRSGVLVR